MRGRPGMTAAAIELGPQGRRHVAGAVAPGLGVTSPSAAGGPAAGGLIVNRPAYTRGRRSTSPETCTRGPRGPRRAAPRPFASARPECRERFLYGRANSRTGHASRSGSRARRSGYLVQTIDIIAILSSLHGRGTASAGGRHRAPIPPLPRESPDVTPAAPARRAVRDESNPPRRRMRPGPSERPGRWARGTRGRRSRSSMIFITIGSII